MAIDIGGSTGNDHHGTRPYMALSDPDAVDAVLTTLGRMRFGTHHAETYQRAMSEACLLTEVAQAHRK